MTVHVPLVVRARLATPLSIDKPIPFEGILYDARFRADPSTYGTPLGCLAYDRGIPKASVGFVAEDGLEGVVWNTTTAVRSIVLSGDDAARIHVPKGAPKALRTIDPADKRYRNNLRRYVLLEGVAEVVFQCVGDPETIERMLTSVEGIGTLRNRGYGEVSSWSVDPSDADRDDCGWFAAGRVVRRLPAEIARSRYDGVLPPGSDTTLGRLEPPHWEAGKEFEIVVPTLRSVMMTASEIHEAAGL